MKVRVVLLLDVDPATWDLEYGTGTRADDVRDDVRDYVRNLVSEQLRANGTGVLLPSGGDR